MIYSNYEFLILLPPLLVWFYSFKSTAAQNGLLLLFSFFFLGWSDPWNIVPAALVMVATFSWFALDARFKIGWKGAGTLLTALVVHLAWWKYRIFLQDSFNIDIPAPDAFAVLVPLGISFYTFEAISAVVDFQRRKVTPKPLNWALFIMFFPHLLAGPIVRYRQLGSQFDSAKRLRARNLGIGLQLFTVGFFKKMAADPIGQMIDPIWQAPGHYSGAHLATALVGFYVQLFLDFSGYTDMGRGIARMFGFRLPVNFRAPMFAASPGDFYQRWHVSLSNWIRTFLYENLAVAVYRRIENPRVRDGALLIIVIAVMALFGLWHGSAWHFVAFGVAQGVVIAGWAAATRGAQPRTWPTYLLSVVVLQATWLFSLVLFRAPDMRAAGQFLAGLSKFTESPPQQWVWVAAALAATAAIQLVDYNVRRRPLAKALTTLRTTLMGALVVLVLLAGGLAWRVHHDADRVAAANGATSGSQQSFIYFRF